jgi:membrane-associated phospholipid phosphatase
MEWQLSTLQWIQGFKHPLLDIFFSYITMSAEETFFIVFAAFGLWCYNKTLAQRVGFAFITSTALNPFLKSLFAVDRPIGQEAIESLRIHTAEGYAFPSGHTQGATSFWFGLLLYFKHRWVTVVSVSMIVLVALSRMYLGVHWPVDVVAGIAFGIAWVFFVNWLFDYAEARNNLHLLWFIVLPFFIPYFLFPENKPLVVSLGSSIGILSGIILERRHINFCVKAKLWQQAVKFISGLAVLILLKVVLKLAIPLPPQYADLIRYAFIGFWLTAGAPYLFIRLGLASATKQS